MKATEKWTEAEGRESVVGFEKGNALFVAERSALLASLRPRLPSLAVVEQGAEQIRQLHLPPR